MSEDTTTQPEVLDRFAATQMSLAGGPQVSLGEGAKARLGLLGNQASAQRQATAGVGTVTDEAKQRMAQIDPSSFDNIATDTSKIAGSKFNGKDFTADANVDDPTSQTRDANAVSGEQSDAQGRVGKETDAAKTHLQDVFKTRTDTLRKFSDGYNDWIIGLPTSGVGTLGTANNQETDSLGINQTLAQGTGGNAGALAALHYGNVSALDAAQLGGQINALRGQASQNLQDYQGAQSAQAGAVNTYRQSIKDAGTAGGKFMDARSQALSDARDQGNAAITSAQSGANDAVNADAKSAMAGVNDTFAQRYKTYSDANAGVTAATGDKADYATLLAQYNALSPEFKNAKVGQDFAAALEAKKTRDDAGAARTATTTSSGYNESTGAVDPNMNSIQAEQALNPGQNIGDLYKAGVTGNTLPGDQQDVAASLNKRVMDQYHQALGGFQSAAGQGFSTPAQQAQSAKSTSQGVISLIGSNGQGELSQATADKVAQNLNAVPADQRNTPEYQAAVQAQQQYLNRMKTAQGHKDSGSKPILNRIFGF